MVMFLFSARVLADTARFALVAGNNQGNEHRETLRYTHRDARKMFDLLTQLGRFKKDNTVLLLEGSAKEFWQQLKSLEAKAAAAQQAGQDTMLLIYYSGHAAESALELGNSLVKFSDLRRFLERSPMQVRLAFVDSCHSGQLIASKGARRGAEFKINVNDEISSSGYAIITSSAQNELSQESRELRGAFFTHYLASALRGNADTSNDGKVTLQEAYKYAYAQTLAQTSGNIGVSQHPMYHFQLKGKGEIVLTHTRKAYSALEIPFIEDGRILLLDGIGEEVLAEAEARRNERIRLSVPPGPYIVYIIKKSGAVRIAEADVLPRETTTLTPDDFSTTTLKDAVSKGGLFRTPEYTWRHRAGIFTLLRSTPLNGVDPPWGVGLHYRLTHATGIQPAIRVFTTRSAHEETARKYYDVAISAGIGYLFNVNFLQLRFELLIGYEHMFQDETPHSNVVVGRPHSSAFSGIGTVGIEVPLAMVYLFADVGAGGRIYQIASEGWRPRFEFQAIAGAGFSWGTQ